MDSIHFDFRHFDPARTVAILPSSVWNRPDRRVSSPVRVRSVHLDMVRIPVSPLSDVIASVFSLLGPSWRLKKSHHSSTDVEPPDTVDLERWVAKRGKTNRYSICMVGIPLAQAPRFHPASFQVRYSNLDAEVVSRVNLRRVNLHSPPSAAIVHLRAIVEDTLRQTQVKTNTPIDRIEFVVGSDQVKKVVEDAIAASTWDLSKKRSRVIKI